jgi:hypothetical protein
MNVTADARLIPWECQEAALCLSSIKDEGEERASQKPRKESNGYNEGNKG